MKGAADVTPEDPYSPPGWAEQRLLIQRCDRCSEHQYYPRPFCTHCGATSLRLVESSGRGRVYSYTVVHRAVGSRFDAPYVIGIIRLEEGVQLLSHVVDVDPSEVRCEMEVRLRWDAPADGDPLPVFTAA